MKIYRIAWPRNKFDILTNKVSEDVCLFIKNNYSQFRENVLEVRNLVFNGINIKLHTVIIDEDKDSLVSVNGATDRNTLELYVYATFNKRNFRFKNHLNLLWQRTNRAIRHEIDHIQHLIELKKQGKPFTKGYDPSKFRSDNLLEKFNERIKYLSEEYERTAFIRALKTDAVRNRISVINSIKEFIHEQLFTSNITTEKEILQEVGPRAIQTEQFFIKQYIIPT